MWKVLLQSVRHTVGISGVALTSRAFSKAVRGPQREEWSRVRLKQLQQHASRMQGECLSDQYEHGKKKLLWRCSRGHTWRASAESINAGSWCQTCAGKAPVGLGRLKEHARGKGGECLAETYKNSATKLPWKCQQGHTWMASASNVLNAGSWCPHCAGKAPVGLCRLQHHADSWAASAWRHPTSVSRARYCGSATLDTHGKLPRTMFSTEVPGVPFVHAASGGQKLR